MDVVRGLAANAILVDLVDFLVPVVDKFVTTVPVFQKRNRWHVVEHRRQKVLAVAKRLFRALALGDVGHDIDDAAIRRRRRFHLK